MKYKVELKPKALKDCKKIDRNILNIIFLKLELLSDNLKGDVKKLTNFTPEYRLRVGDYRILFEIVEDMVVVYRICHRKEVYR